jgi:hypothetical protein
VCPNIIANKFSGIVVVKDILKEAVIATSNDPFSPVVIYQEKCHRRRS